VNVLITYLQKQQLNEELEVKNERIAQLEAQLKSLEDKSKEALSSAGYVVLMDEWLTTLQY
jgi:cell division protein FtsB